jgi:hypothetical protein
VVGEGPSRMYWTACGIGVVLTAIGFTERAHLHWLLTLGLLLNLTSPCIVLIPLYRYVDRRFLPVYEQLEGLCVKIGVPCSIRTSQIKWFFRFLFVSLLLSLCFGAASEVVRSRRFSFQLVSLAWEMVFVCGFFQFLGAYRGSSGRPRFPCGRWSRPIFIKRLRDRPGERSSFFCWFPAVTEST